MCCDRCFSGIGTTTAETLARMGGRVILACRTVKRGQALIDRWNADAKAEGARTPVDCEVMHLDCDSLDSVREFAKKWGARNEPLHVLINNAVGRRNLLGDCCNLLGGC